ncbi:MAG TPA: TAXI family TRAP transporter solute-binding subunit [Roseiarcus sp.]
MKQAFWRTILLALILAVPASMAAENPKFHMFASVGAGEITGIYYPLGNVICGIVNQNLRESGVRCSRESTPGSVYNVDALRDHELEFALVQSDVAYDAYHGTGAYSQAPFPALRSVLALHLELVTVVARAEIHDLGDLAGKRIVAGPAGSGSRATWDAMVKALGWKEGQTPRTVDLPVDAIGNALCKGSIDASLLVLGHPSGKIRDLLASCALNLIPVEGPAIDSLVAAAPYLKKGRIPASAYGLPADVPSFGVNAILMTTADMDARAVSDFASSLGAQIKALQDRSPVLENLTVQDMVTEALPAPLHPAALEAYRKLKLLK